MPVVSGTVCREAEQSVLGSILLDGVKSAAVVIDVLRPDDFYYRAHGTIYEAITRLFLRNERIDVVTVAEELSRMNKLEEIGGLVYLKEIVDIVPSSSGIEYYTKIMIDYSTKNKIKDIAFRMAKTIDENPEEAYELFDREMSMVYRMRGARNVVSVSAVVDNVLKELDTDKEDNGFLKTGFNSIDRIIGGISSGSYFVVAARPSMGKTAWALNLAFYLAKMGIPVGIFSLEMPREHIVRRLLCIHSGQGFYDLDVSNIDTRKSAEFIKKLPIFIDDSTLIKPLDLFARIRHLIFRHNVKLVIVDYLQLLRAQNSYRTKQEEMAEVSSRIKSIIRSTKVPILVLSQLSRAVELRNNKRPILSDLRDSGTIEQDADVVAFLYREDEYDPHAERGVTEFIIRKNRNGATGMAKLHFNRRSFKFTDYVDYQVSQIAR